MRYSRAKLLAIGALVVAIPLAYFVVNTHRPEPDIIPSRVAVESSTYPSKPDTNQGAKQAAGFGTKPRSQPTWGSRYAKSIDAYAFMLEAAQKALDGDGAAAYYVAEAVSRCTGTTAALAGATIAEKLSARESQLAAVPALSDENRATILARKTATYKYCERYATGAPFAALPQEKEEYRHSQFWRDIAYQAGDPLAHG